MRFLRLFFAATLHVGDEILEISGISVANQTIDNLQRLLVSEKS